MTLESWLQPARVLAGLAFILATGVASASAAYYGATGKLERVTDTAERAASEAKAATASVAQLRADTEKKEREQQAAVDARFAAMEAQRQADEAARQKDREELIRMGVTLMGLQRDSQETRGDLKVLLDRLNANGTRTRTVRDYPQ